MSTVTMTIQKATNTGTSPKDVVGTFSGTDKEQIRLAVMHVLKGQMDVALRLPDPIEITCRWDGSELPYLRVRL